MQNLKITLKLSSHAAISDNPLDGLLAKLWFEKLKKTDSFNGDYFQTLPFLELDKEGFYHISYPVYETKLLTNQEIHKAFMAKEFIKHYPYKKVTGTMFDVSRGKYKSYVSPFERQQIDDVVFYLRGDEKEIKDLLSNLKFIGKKSGYGWGKISTIEIKNIKEDCSVVKDGVLMRNIPKGSEYECKIDKNKCKTAYRLMQLTHPYWDRGREVECLVKI